MLSMMGEDELRRVFTHIFLPPQLPQKLDDQSDTSLVEVAVSGLRALRRILPSSTGIGNALEALQNLQAVNSLPGGATSESALARGLATLKTGRVIPVHVTSQNAAIMITRQDHGLIFEEFELSPRNEAVMTTKGRLIRTFPGLAVAVDTRRVILADLVPAVANMIATMCQQPVPGTQPQSKKARSSHDESRDTTEPTAVSELFIGVLRGFGEAVSTSAISKNTREEVLWKDAKTPWRRSPMWLLIRVVLQLTIERSSDGSHLLYKEIMAFLMSLVLQACMNHDLASDVLYAMNAKISYRLHKLQEKARLGGDNLHDSLLARIESTLHRSSGILSHRWVEIQQGNSQELDLAALAELDFEADTLVLLPTLDKYIKKMNSRQDKTASITFSPIPGLIKHALSTLPQLPKNNSTESCYAAANLQQFEQWVAADLESWTSSYTQSDMCKKLHTLMTDYHCLAINHYSGNPEAISVMLLTIFELWIACDKAAVSIDPLLAEYNPDIPPDILQSLLLPFHQQMERTAQVESYINQRASRPWIKQADKLFEMKSSEGFASRYFHQSQAHQSLLASILKQAEHARLTKRCEFQRIKGEYQDLDRLHNNALCEYVTVIIDDWLDPPETMERHSSSCAKCLYREKRDALTINVHEWPLPEDPLEAEAVVFELVVPSWLAFWRDTRFYLLQNVLKGERDSTIPSTLYRLSERDPHLSQQYFQGSKCHRIDLLSESKPFTVTHYREKKMNAALDVSNVCVANGLRYLYYDTTSSRYVGTLRYQDTVARSCSYTLMNQQLQRYILRPASSPDGPPPNAVIAGQDSCPDDMSLEEYKELASVPLGHHIQWANVILQLAMPGVDFKKADTTLVFLQCIYQTGPPNGSVLRAAHNMFQDDAKVASLLTQLKAAIERVKQNWESAQALSLFTSILTRALSLNARAVDTCYELLAHVRAIALEWIGVLRDRAHAAIDHQDRTAFIAKSVEVALICASTFDVDQTHLSTMLISAANASILFQISIVVQQGEYIKLRKEQHLELLHLRHYRLLHRCYKKLVRCRNGLDDAVTKSWSAYMPGSTGWRPVSDAADHWLKTRTVGDLDVHYNLLNGELLVDGLPLDQPPKHYRDQPLYRTLFGRAVVEVMPASSPGFHFSTKRRFGGCAVQLGMRSSDGGATDTLVVQTVDGNDSFETIPSHLLAQAFPSHFVEDYIQWYDHKSGKVEFRPLQTAWESHSARNWTLTKIKDGRGWQLSNGHNAVVGLHGATSRAVSAILRPLADPGRIHCLLHVTSSLLEVDIPTCRHGFSLSSGRSSLRSREFRNMAVDCTQSIGTLVGFENKLLLRTDAGERLLLVLESTVSYTKRSGHTAVSVNRTSESRVHVLHVDTQLDRLVDNGDLQSKLYLAHLHALTSFCLPDPFTHRTGTEQALSILASSAVRSFDQLSQANVDMLANIARLSPCRQYYPAHKRVMQTVSWDHQLDFLAQHAGLRTHVQEIYQQAERSASLYPEVSLLFPRLGQLEDDLQHRDKIRASLFRVSGFGAEDHCVSYDTTYSARDRNADSHKGTNAAVMSGIMYRSGHDNHWETPSVAKLWQQMRAIPKINGPELHIDDKDLLYDAGHVHDGLNFILSRLPALHRSMVRLQGSQHQKFSSMAWLSSLAFHLDEADCGIVQIVAMFSKPVELARIQAPTVKSFSVQEGKDCSAEDLKRIVGSHRRHWSSCPEYRLERWRNEKAKAYGNRRKQAWQSASDSAVASFVSVLNAQWPCEVPVEPSLQNAPTYVNIDGAMADIKRKFQMWHDNTLLYEYLEEIVHEMRHWTTTKFWAPGLIMTNARRLSSVSGYTSIDYLFSLPAPQLPDSCHSLELLRRSETRSSRLQSPRLQSLIRTLEGSTGASKYAQRYVADLKLSLAALVAQDDDLSPVSDVTTEDLVLYLEYCKGCAAEIYSVLAAYLSSASTTSSARCLQRPRVSPILLLQQLSHRRWNDLQESWKKHIIAYGIALTQLQRAERLLRLAESSHSDDFVGELRNIGHTNWSPYDRPESLLMEVESGIMIRKVQEEIGKQMREPDCCRNAVMQLNMGEGKSSVIAPMVGATLADGHSLVRVIVAKPQSKQMAQMLITKLGGLVDRRIYYLPISRSLKLDTAAAAVVDSILRECMLNRGILLLQPEHILSLKLMAPECYISGREEVGRQLMETQDFLDKHTRDIVDESDENFNVRFELIYTMGMQNPIELSPDRWFFIQQVLELVRRLAPTIAEQHPGSLDVHSNNPGRYPRVRILRADVGPTLVSYIAAEICQNGLDGLRISRQPEMVRTAVFSYITKFELDDVEISAVEDGLFWANSTQAPLLLLRGLLAGGVLVFTLMQKRWRVNYGLASRTPSTRLAVPYRAKDSPSLRSEFSHPDVVITLTSLCYYYQGLDDEDLFTALAHLIESDQADIEYQAWVQDAFNLPYAFQQLQGVNLKDRLQCGSELFPALRHGKSVADYFLSHIVFPKEMKEFPHKLSASGWDIGKQSTLLTTGFSGTNDSQYLLPLDVEHLDSDEQKHTNALVLEYLLQDGNSVELIAPAKASLTDAEILLSTVTQLETPVQVILDVGAQILELTNMEVAKSWLKASDASKKAVVFVNDDDELCVIDRKDRVDLLRTSSFATCLDLCLVFLDESHTRGTDLKLPVQYRAAVTLGANLTKDRLVQACMRMRKLGKGQTVVFCVPLEVQSKIRGIKSDRDSEITVADVLLWSIAETHAEMRRSMPLWAVQGQRFIRQQTLWQQVTQDGKTTMTKCHAEEFLEGEAQSIEQRYLPGPHQRPSSYPLATADAALQVISDRCREFDHLQFSSSTLQEEQERELSPEIEQQRQVQRAPPATPAPHHLHPEVEQFALSGAFKCFSRAYMPAFESLSRLSCADACELSQLAGEGTLLVSVDFATTVKQHGIASVCDAFQRDVNWLLTRKAQGSDAIEYIMIISPYEANLLHPYMRGSPNTLHVYKPRSNSGYAALDDLGFHTVSAATALPAVPRRLAVQLNLFAGQLYISSYTDYLEMCSFLGLSAQLLTKDMEEGGWRLDANGFVLCDGQGRVGGSSGLTKSPVNFFRVFISKIRRNGDGIAKTHMGSLLEGALFPRSEWDGKGSERAVPE